MLQHLFSAVYDFFERTKTAKSLTYHSQRVKQTAKHLTKKAPPLRVMPVEKSVFPIYLILANSCQIRKLGKVEWLSGISDIPLVRAFFARTTFDTEADFAIKLQALIP